VSGAGREDRDGTGAAQQQVCRLSEETYGKAGKCFDAVFDFGILHHVPVWQTGVAEIRRVLRPGGTFFFEEVTRAALNRWMYRAFLNHPKENRFSEVEFLRELTSHNLQPASEIRRVLFGDIFIGVAKLGNR
jgi:SAM-dependent methyltransferase